MERDENGDDRAKQVSMYASAAVSVADRADA